MDDIGVRLRRTRRAQDVTLQQLAAQSGVAYQSINRIERGHTQPKIETVAKLATALNVDMKWLAFGDDEPAREDK
jgi:transcriptional regulator with XRE-family HTH domain